MITLQNTMFSRGGGNYRSFLVAAAILCGASAAYAALPGAYTAVEYIESDGTQYIDTGVVPTTATRVVCDFRLTVMPSVRVRCGWASKGNKEAFWFGTDNGPTNFSASVCGNSVQANTGVPVDTTRHTFDISMSAIKFDDATVANPGAAFTDAASGNTMLLFASRQEWDPNIGTYGSMEIYSCQIYDGTTLTLDFVPAVRLSDGAAGLYETVNGDFYENQGSGDFSAGPAKLADYYVAVEYIESDGNQYIDTLFTLGSNHVSTIEVQPTELPTINGTDPGGIMTYYGCRTGHSSENVSFFLEYGGGQPKFTLDFNNSGYATYRLSMTTSVSTANRYVIVDSATSRSVTEYNSSGTVVSSASDNATCADAFSCAGTAYLFAVNDMSGSSPTPLWNKAKMKFYGGTVTTADDGTPCCNLVPCLRNGTEPGVYDTVRDIFLANAGSGKFTFGEETGVVYGEVSGTFVASSIPDQTISSFAELFAGVEPSVTVSNLTTETELVLDTDYTVSYSGNTAIGTAYAVITGMGDYDGKTVLVPFAITGFTAYYAVSGGSDPADSSSVSGATNGNNVPTGWSTTKGGAKAVNGITADNAIYYVWQTRWMRTQPSSRPNFATPAASAIVVDPGCRWTLGDKMLNKTLTLSNVVVRTGGTIVVDPIGESGTTLYSNTIGGTFDLADGASMTIYAKTTASDNISKQYILSAAVTGTGAVWMPSMYTGATYSTPLANQITGDLSGFTGDIGTWNGVAAVSLELVNAASIPGDPEPSDVAYVVVTNGATLKIDQDWVSPTNRIWILGDGATPTINVPSGKTVTINGDLVGSVGFNKTGTGTLVLKGASPDFSGTVTISGGEVKLSGKAATLTTAPRITWVEDGGTYVVASLAVYPVADQTVYDLATLAAGVRPSVTVSNLEDMVELVLDTDYTVAYSDNTACGQATATVTGKGEYDGTVRDVTFNIHAVKQITADDYALSADEDWTGFESIDVASGAVIDLEGHDLTISGLDGAGEITDSIGGGSLIFDIPAVFTSGYTAAITGVSLTGKLKLVKTGAGVLTAAKTGQTYTGGNEILGGVLRLAASANMLNSYLGPNASEAYCPIYIGPDGILDPAGSSIWGYHRITIDGGMVSNTVANTSDNWIFNPVINVTDDFTFATTQNYKWMSGGSINLQGHTVTVWIDYGKWLHLSAAMTNGAMDVVTGGYLQPFSNDVYSPTLDVTANAALAMHKAWTIHDYHPTFQGNYGQGSAALNVLGTFTPDTDYYFAPTMQDGSAIDLSAKTGVWSAYSSLTQGGNRTTKFAAGATVAILLGSRTPAYGERIVTWGTKPADSVSLTNATYVLRVENDGLYVDSPRTFNPSFLPDIASARLVSDVEVAIEASLAVTDLVTDETLALGTDYAYAYTIDHGVCTVTVTGKGANAGVSVVRRFSIGEICFKAADYTYSMDITPGEGKVTNTLTNFPVLVRLSESIPGFKYEKCRADELRFALADGTMLAHEVDYWNANGESTVWVNVPELTAETVIRAYWGFKLGREPLARPSDEAWSDYVGVWHFSEESGSARDSSVNGYHTTDGGTVSNLDAKVGLSRNINKASLNTSVSNLADTGSKKPLTTVSKFTASGWMLSTLDIGVGSNAKYPQMMRNKNVWSDGNGWFTGYEGTSVKFNAVGSGSTRTIFDFPKSVYTNWVYITAVFNDSSCILYEDGAFVTNCAIDTVKANTSYALRFGLDLTGRIDEYRIHDGVQSAAYVGADYATQTDAGFLSYGEVQGGGGFFIILR